MTLSRFAPAFFTLAAAVATVAAAGPQSTPPPEDFTALAVAMGNVGPAQPTTVDISITRWSTEEERARLITTLVEKGADALLEELRDTEPVGRIRTLDSVGYDLRFAHQAPLEGGGRRVVIATDRPIAFWEAREQPRSRDYPFTMIELRLKPNGKGEGKLSIATKIVPVGKTIYLEDYGTQPVLLTNVQARKRDK
jgi:hypothetical protein